jgi:hypothetical protein
MNCGAPKLISDVISARRNELWRAEINFGGAKLISKFQRVAKNVFLLVLASTALF